MAARTKGTQAAGASLLVVQALLLRLAVYKAFTWLRQTTSATEDGGIEAVRGSLHALSSVALTLTLCTSLFSEKARRAFPQFLLFSMTLSSALREACQKEIVQREFREPVIDDTEGDYMEFISASIDTQPSSIAAVPLAMLFVLKTCGTHLLPGIILGPTIAALLPNAMARIVALQSGLGALSWASLIQTSIAGVSSAVAVIWLILDVRTLAHGHTMMGRKVNSQDAGGGHSQDQGAYIAARAFADFMIVPLLCIVLAFRTWIWLLTLGKVFPWKNG